MAEHSSGIRNIQVKNEATQDSNKMEIKTFFCPVCSNKSKDIKALKFHIVLEHSDLHMCLWCVEKKGWSDEFTSQEAYNAHYESQHKGIIQARAKQRRNEIGVAKAEKRVERKKQKESRRHAIQERKTFAPLIKRKKHNNSCNYCPDFPIFSRGFDLDRHLISVHNHDFCKKCHMIGPAMKIRVHIVLNHPDSLCHLCGASSPIFPNISKVCLHLQHCHAKSSICPKYFCTNCSNVAFADVAGFVAHTETCHPAQGELRPMKSKATRLLDGDGDLFGLGVRNIICPLRNDSGQDCFLISVLHLFSQTSLPGLLPKLDSHANCQNSSCLIANFFHKYLEQRERFFPHEIVENYVQFGVTCLPLQVGDLIRLFLTNLTSENTHHLVTQTKAIQTSFRTALLWKFSCLRCKRFSVVRRKEFVLKVNGFDEASFEELLHQFLQVQSCRCGNKIEDVSPIVEEIPEYLLIEIDRSATVDCGVHELLLYPLQLKNSYKLLGNHFSLFATINYNLDYADGGHYTTLLIKDRYKLGSAPILNINEMEFTSIHETDIRFNATDQKFDTETLIVVLARCDPIQDIIPTQSDLIQDIIPPQSDPIAIPSQSDPIQDIIPPQKSKRMADHSYAEEKKVYQTNDNTQSIVQSTQTPENLDILPETPKFELVSFPEIKSKSESSLQQSGNLKCTGNCSAPSATGFCCDNFGLLSNDQSIIGKYKDEYEKKMEERISREINWDGEEDVSLRALGDQVFQSKIYRIKKMKQNMKDLQTIDYIPTSHHLQTVNISNQETGGSVVSCNDVDFGQI